MDTIIYDGTYSINFMANELDFRINVYNKKNSKKYELIEHELVKKYESIGVDIIPIIVDCLTNSKYEFVDNDKHITFLFKRDEHFKLTIRVPNILCEYKEASLLDLKLENELLKKKIDELLCRIEKLECDFEDKITEITLDNNVKVPKGVKKLVVCGNTLNCNKYVDVFADALMIRNFNRDVFFSLWNCSAGPNRHAATTAEIAALKSKPIDFLYGNFSYSGCSNASWGWCPTIFEHYVSPEQYYLCFNKVIDCEKIKDLHIDQLGLFNITIKNLNKLKHVKELYLFNVIIEEDDYLHDDIQLDILGLRSCHDTINICDHIKPEHVKYDCWSLPEKIMESINDKCMKKEIRKILINDENPMKHKLCLAAVCSP